MADSNALVPYRGTAISATATTTWASSPNSLISARYFTAQTGHALVTELLYRLLIDILNRLLASLHRFAVRQFDSLQSFLEKKYEERQQAIEAAREATEKAKEGLKISEEVSRVAVKRGFIDRGAVSCPITEDGGRGERGERRSRPRGWVGSVLEAIQEGRIVERDFWGGHPFQN